MDQCVKTTANNENKNGNFDNYVCVLKLIDVKSDNF